MKKQPNEKQKLLLYRYGYHSFCILLIEIGIVALLYAGIELPDGLYNLLYSIQTTELLFALIPLPIGYFAIRGLLSDCDYAKRNGYLAPFITMSFLSYSDGMIFKIPLLIIFWFLFIVSIYKLIKYRKRDYGDN